MTIVLNTDLVLILILIVLIAILFFLIIGIIAITTKFSDLERRSESSIIPAIRGTATEVEKLNWKLEGTNQKIEDINENIKSSKKKR